MADDEVAPLISAWFASADPGPKVPASEPKWVTPKWFTPDSLVFTSKPETHISPKYTYGGSKSYSEYYAEQMSHEYGSVPHIPDLYGQCIICAAFDQPMSSGPSKKSVPAVLAQSIPAIYEKVKPNCECYNTATYRQIYGNDCRVKIYDQVVHLNDVHRWTREAIADWLETLDADLQFKLPESPENTEGNVE